jgi:tagatose 6-phosphate kinase
VLVVVCLNPAVDVTYRIERLRPGTSHRVRESAARAGGKGVNVSRVLCQLGVPMLLTGFVGGRRGDEISADLADAAIATRFVQVAGASRSTVTVVDDEDATVFNEAGPHVSAAEWARFVDDFGNHTSGADVVVLTGSLPPGVPVDAYAQLTTRAHARGAAVLVDADGDALHCAMPAEPDLVVPNHHEAAQFGANPEPALDGLLRAGARNAVITLGAQGLLASVDGHRYRARPGENVRGNPTGAGDALAAVLARGLAVRAPWQDTLRDAVAIAGAAVALPHAGGFDPATADRLRPGVELVQLGDPRSG